MHKTFIFNVRCRLKATSNWIRYIYGVLLILYGGIACADTMLVPPLDDLTTAYWSVRVNYPAVQLSKSGPHNSLQLAVIPLAADGTKFTVVGEDTPVSQTTVWSSGDSSKVKISQSGLLTAVDETADTRIEVRHTIGEVTHFDSVWVVVKDVDDPPTLTEFSIKPTDSLKRAAGYFGWYTFPVTALDATGRPITDFPIRWRSSNVKLAAFYDASQGWLNTYIPSQVTISASTWIYGIEKMDSFTLEIGWPVSMPNQLLLAEQVVTTTGTVIFAPSSITAEMGPGGRALFWNRTGFGPINVRGKSPREGISIDVIFDDPSVALPGGDGWIGDTSGVGGNIIGLVSDTTDFAIGAAHRRFIKPGRHFFTVQPLGYRGNVYVHDK